MLYFQHGKACRNCGEKILAAEELSDNNASDNIQASSQQTMVYP
jgi:hypothetical protein